MAAGTSHSNHGVRMIPFYIFYSMFGYQRVGDFVWAAGDMRTRGFLLGGTSGRTTLNGEGLQHQDGHGHLLFSVVPSCVAYDPCYAYELVVILQDGLRRMYAEDEQVFYYITVMNENYSHPAMPEGVEEGIRRGMYLLRAGRRGSRAPGAAPRLGHHPARGRGRRATCSRSSSTSRPTSGASPASASCGATASPSIAGTGCIRSRSRARRTSPICCAIARARSSRRPTT